MKHRKSVLGRGLSALLDNSGEELILRDAEGHEMMWSQANIPIHRIEGNPYQPRTDFEESSLSELSDSIREQGIIQPITVRKAGFEKYQLISGERRLRAAQMAGLTHIPAFIRTAEDSQMLEMALVENLQRKDLNSMEVAISFQRLVEEFNYTQETLSEKVGKNRSTITNYLRLLKLPPEIQVALRDSKITMGHARALISIEDPATQLQILQKTLAKELNVRDVEKLAQAASRKETTLRERKKAELPPRYRSVQLTIEKKTGCRTELKRARSGKGSIRLQFSNDKELDKILKFFS